MRFERGLQPTPIEHVAIIGCGFSGALQAINLVRHEGPRATVIERRSEAGKGVAYSSLHPQHVLNVRAAKMSALPDQPNHFVNWLTHHGHPFTGTDFVPRQVYGTYLQDLLAETVRDSGGRLKLVQADVESVEYDGNARVHLSSGEVVTADRAVLAVGNLPPHDPDGFRSSALPARLYQTDPWAFGMLDALDPDADVLLLGTGLTMVDVCLLLKATGHRGKIFAVSRRGLVPHRHDEPHAPPSRRSENPRGGLAEMTKDVRSRARVIDWQDAVDELRPVTQSLWRGLSHDQ
ncbi:MAG: FAD/NAD(P)-binding protein, partial [Sphingomicrobium sp.]